MAPAGDDRGQQGASGRQPHPVICPPPPAQPHVGSEAL